MLMNVPDIATLIARLLTLMVAFTVHEFAHAWSADELGDETPRLNGRLTLNPLAHLDVIGSLMLLIGGFGWAKPVPVNPYRLRYGSAGFALVAAAGPISNFIMALLAAIPFRLGLLFPAFTSSNDFIPSPDFLLTTFIWVNIGLMLFNLIPLVPLDGSKILRGFAPREWDSWLTPLEEWGFFILIILITVGGGVLSLIIGPPANFLFRTMLGF